MRIASRKTPRALVLAAWSGFFVWLLATGEVTRYLGPRTYWVVVFGAVVLGLVFFAHLITLRADTSSSPSVADLGAALALLLPLVLVIVIPSPQLGSLAASRKSAVGVSAAGIGPPQVTEVDQISFQEIHFANESDEYAIALGIGEGLELELVGFVTHPEQSRDAFSLTRFYVSCCAADAVPYSVTIEDAASDYLDDTWLEVAGSLARRNGKLVLVADEVREIEAPKDPYLW